LSSSSLAWWQQAYESAWGYSVNPSIRFPDLGYPDSCVMAYWEADEPLNPGDTYQIITYFGNGVPPFIDYRDIRIDFTNPLDSLGNCSNRLFLGEGIDLLVSSRKLIARRKKLKIKLKELPLGVLRNYRQMQGIY
jgi:hypothetical protein